MMALRNEKALKKKDGQFRNEALFERISEEYVQPKDPVTVRARVSPMRGESPDGALCLRMFCVFQGPEVSQAVKQPLSKNAW